MFSERDARQIEAHGLTLAQAMRQVEIFRRPAQYMELLRPCVPGDGILQIDPTMKTALVEFYEREGPPKDCVKFVPASGAASRMFKALLKYLNQAPPILRDRVLRHATDGDSDGRHLLAFMDNLKRFAFFDDLRYLIAQRGQDVDALMSRGDFTLIIRLLLTEEGLGYASLPKGLLKFHGYPEGGRTAFEEHLVEAASYVRAKDGVCNLHFTVSAEHMERFQGLLARVRPLYEERHHARFQVDLSTQKSSTDTLAVDLLDNPFRDNEGQILFRPGGHGALLENLNGLEADIVFVKNIDNVVPDRLKSTPIEWKKALGGYMISLQGQVFHHLKTLTSEAPEPSAIDRAIDFAATSLCWEPQAMAGLSQDQRRRCLLELLNRPIRICGMVRNANEPGGGPFWVREKGGAVSRQVVETAQINPDSGGQQAILAQSTHFSPVDLVCGIRDWQGRPFDLRRYVDESAVFISRKSKDGKDLKALEHPGLWNGSMAGWITVFVEVPTLTFNPVKTVTDLLRPEHQPA